MGKESDVKWLRKSKTKVVVELPKETIEYIESHSELCGLTPEKYINNLVTIDILENELAALKYSTSEKYGISM